MYFTKHLRKMRIAMDLTHILTFDALLQFKFTFKHVFLCALKTVFKIKLTLHYLILYISM